jgi:hypothetical protein
MPHHFHAVVSIDHAEATIFEFAETDVTEHRIKATDRQGNIHHKAGSVGSGARPRQQVLSDSGGERLEAFA